MLIETTELRREESRKRGAALRRLLGSHTRAATWFLPLAAFLFGLTVSAVAFVGLWRHTASQADSAQATAQQAAHDLAAANSQIGAFRVELKTAQSNLALARSALARSHRQQSSLSEELRVARRETSRLAARLPGQLSALDSTAGSLVRRSDSLASALAGLQSYLARGGSSIDPAFLQLQVQYVSRASALLQTETGELERQIGAVVKTASSLSKAG